MAKKTEITVMDFNYPTTTSGITKAADTLLGKALTIYEGGFRPVSSSAWSDDDLWDTYGGKTVTRKIGPTAADKAPFCPLPADKVKPSPLSYSIPKIQGLAPEGAWIWDNGDWYDPISGRSGSAPTKKPTTKSWKQTKKGWRYDDWETEDEPLFPDEGDRLVTLKAAREGFINRQTKHLEDIRTDLVEAIKKGWQVLPLLEEYEDQVDEAIADAAAYNEARFKDSMPGHPRPDLIERIGEIRTWKSILYGLSEKK